MNKKYLLGASVVFALGVSVSAHAVNIDLFTTPQGEFADSIIDGNPIGGSVLDAGPGVTIIGGERDLSVNKSTDTVGDPTIGAVRTTVDSGILSFNQDSGAGGTLDVQWDGPDNSLNFDITGLGSIDLAAIASQFDFIVFQADAGFDFSIEVWSANGDFTRAFGTGVAVPQGTGPVAFSIPFSDLFDAGNCATAAFECGAADDPTTAADFTQVSALRLIVNAEERTDIDLSLGQIVAVPEPATLSLLGMGLLGIGASVRKRKIA